jgi:hypothetical protein
MLGARLAEVADARAVALVAAVGVKPTEWRRTTGRGFSAARASSKASRRLP